jgi:hypothetical protein
LANQSIKADGAIEHNIDQYNIILDIFVRKETCDKKEQERRGLAYVDDLMDNIAINSLCHISELNLGQRSKSKWLYIVPHSPSYGFQLAAAA